MKYLTAVAFALILASGSVFARGPGAGGGAGGPGANGGGGGVTVEEAKDRR